MANPIIPAALPIWCTIPVMEKITFTDPTTGETQVIEQSNIATPDISIMRSGFTQENALVEQDFNWLFNSICQWVEYFKLSVNRPPSYTAATLPLASANGGSLIFVSDLNGGTLAVSNGTNWIKLKMDGNI